MTVRAYETFLVDEAASASALSKSSWDALVTPGELFASHAWMHHLEFAAGPDPVLCCWVDGALSAAVPMWSGEASSGGLFHLPGFFPEVRGPWSRPFLWLGARRSVHNALPCVRGPQRTSVQARVLNAARERAREWGRAGVIMPYMPLAAATELAACHADARVLLHAAEAVADIPAGGKDALLSRLGRHNRKRRRAEQRSFAQAGYTIDVAEIDGVVDAAADLITRNRRKYGSEQGSDWMHRVFAAQRRVGLFDQAVVLVCRRATQVVALVVCYRHGDVLHVRYYGSERTTDSRCSPYFVLAGHAPLEYAAATGLRTVHLSTSSLEAKARRGATLQPLAAVVLSEHESIERSHVRAHNQHFAARYRARFGGWSLDVAWDVEGL